MQLFFMFFSLIYVTITYEHRKQIYGVNDKKSTKGDKEAVIKLMNKYTHDMYKVAKFLKKMLCKKAQKYERGNLFL